MSSFIKIEDALAMLGAGATLQEMSDWLISQRDPPSPAGQGELSDLVQRWREASLEGGPSARHYIAGLRACARELEAALAARQPVGEAVELARAKVKIAALELQLATYEAPAQAVDLQKYRSAIEIGMHHCAGFLGDKATRDKLRDLLALIDSQAVGK